MKKSTIFSLVIVVLLLLAASVYSAYYMNYRAAPATGDNTNSSGQVFCTMEAKQCPDGSYVGRVPPTCEFAQCPTTAGAASTTPTNVDTEL